MVQDDRREGAEAGGALEQPLADFGVAADGGLVLVAQVAAPVEHVHRDADLADVVDERRHVQRGALGVAEAELGRHPLGRDGDVVGPLLAVRVAHVDGGRQRLDGLDVGLLQTEGEAFERRLVELHERHLGELGDHVAAGPLGEQQRRVGGRDQALAVAAAGRVVGDADADREARRVRHVEHDAAHALRDALGERRRRLRARARAGS